MNKKQIGGDGYVVNVNEAIGGLPAFSRYSDNYRPIFEGSLLGNLPLNNFPNQMGGDCSSDACDGNLINTTCNNCGNCSLLNNMEGGGKKKSEKKECNCSSSKKSFFDFLKQTGGGSKKIKKKIDKDLSNKKNNINQFYAIKELAHLIKPLKDINLVELNIKLFLKDLNDKKPIKSKKLKENTDKLKNAIAPLGKQNLLILSSLLLLHHFAVQKKGVDIKPEIKVLKGGDSSIGTLLAPLGVNQLGASLLLILLQQAFTYKKTKTDKKIQTGGNPLINLIAPLGTNAFIATGLLIVLEKLFTKTVKSKQDNEKTGKSSVTKKLIGGKSNKEYENLFNLLAPITFNTFANKSSLDKFNKKQNLKKI